MIDDRDAPLALGSQLAAALALLVLVTAIHATALMLISSWRRIDDRALDRGHFTLNSLPLIAALLLALVAAHLVEIAVFAAFYRVLGGVRSIEEALFVSAAAYSTMGGPDGGPLRPWRLVIALESLAGFVFITWSTAFIVGIVERLRR